MRKKKILITLLFVICVPCFAQENQDINTLVKWDLKGLNKNFDFIQREAVNLDESERLEIYNQYKKSELAAVLLNLLPYGIGSFYQGDYLYGGIVLGGVALGATFVGVGISIGIAGLFLAIPLALGEDTQITQIEETIKTFMEVGGIIAGAFYLVGIIRALYYPQAYNKKLKAVLWPDSDSLTLSIIPSVNVAGNDIAVTLVSLKW